MHEKVETILYPNNDGEESIYLCLSVCLLYMNSPGKEYIIQPAPKGTEVY